MRLKKELEDIKARQAEIEAQLSTADIAHQRAMSFPGQIGADYACPDCWVSGRRGATMRAIGGGGRREDRFRCNSCDQVFALPSGE
ncbi:MAG: hypothetical protein FJX54_03365 [Alphaproteobacteria bacterium]|nr:hypothetical protein [Alphaproteobacteria bacterium]